MPGSQALRCRGDVQSLGAANVLQSAGRAGRILDPRPHRVQRFPRLGPGDAVPDAMTVWLFRESLAELGKTLLEQFNRQLNAKGYIARGEQIIDTTIIRAPEQRNTRAALTGARNDRSCKRARGARARGIEPVRLARLVGALDRTRS